MNLGSIHVHACSSFRFMSTLRLFVYSPCCWSTPLYTHRWPDDRTMHLLYICSLRQDRKYLCSGHYIREPFLQLPLWVGKIKTPSVGLPYTSLVNIYTAAKLGYHTHGSAGWYCIRQNSQ